MDRDIVAVGIVDTVGVDTVDTVGVDTVVETAVVDIVGTVAADTAVDTAIVVAADTVGWRASRADWAVGKGTDHTDYDPNRCRVRGSYGNQLR